MAPRARAAYRQAKDRVPCGSDDAPPRSPRAGRRMCSMYDMTTLHSATSVRLDEAGLAALEMLSRTTGQTRSKVIRDALVREAARAGSDLESMYATIAAEDQTDPEHAAYRTASRASRARRDSTKR